MIRNRSEFSTDCVQSPPEEGLSKRTFLKAIALAGLGITPFLNSCGISESGDMDRRAAKNPDSPSRDGAVLKASRPPIDLSAPAKTETATLALG